MNEDKKMETPSFSLHPLLGLDLGERWGREIGELSNRVTHLENSVAKLDAKVDKAAQAIHRLDERIGGVENRLDAKIDGLENRLDAKIDGLENRLDARIDGLEKRLDAKIDGLEKRLDARIDGLEKRFADLTKLMWGFFAALLAAIIAQRLL